MSEKKSQKVQLAPGVESTSTDDRGSNEAPPRTTPRRTITHSSRGGRPPEHDQNYSSEDEEVAPGAVYVLPSGSVSTTTAAATIADRITATRSSVGISPALPSRSVETDHMVEAHIAPNIVELIAQGVQDYLENKVTQGEAVVPEPERQHNGKKFLLCIILVVVVVSIVVVVLLLRAHTDLAPTSVPTMDATEFSAFGYPYIQDSSLGWIYSFSGNMELIFAPGGQNWEIGIGGDNATAVDCAERCSFENAFAGAWNSRDQLCYCYFLNATLFSITLKELEEYCIEPCIPEVGVEFSSVSFQDFDWCEFSYCDDRSFGSVALDYCELVKYDPAKCFGPSPAPASTRPVLTDPAPTPVPTMDATEFSAFGYPYIRDPSLGWIYSFRGNMELIFDPEQNWEIGIGGDNATAVDCAEKCSFENAFAGAWNSRDRLCWCYFLNATLVSITMNELEEYCTEPCVPEVGVEFSSVSFQDFDWCEFSYCDDRSFGSVTLDYCELVKYDPAKCFGPSPSPAS